MTVDYISYHVKMMPFQGLMGLGGGATGLGLVGGAAGTGLWTGSRGVFMGGWESVSNATSNDIESVSYTHLTLPTKA